MRKICLLFLILLMICPALPAIAGTTSGDYTYELLADGTASITGCTASGDITIPAKLDGHKVTNLAEQLFFGAGGITSVSIPASVTYFGNDAASNVWDYVFSYCYDLKSITVDSDNPSFRSVDGVLYTKDKSILINYPAGKEGGSYQVPSSVEYLACTSFASCSKLKHLYLEGSDTYWMTYTFYGDPDLQVHYLTGGMAETKAKSDTSAGRGGKGSGYPVFVEWDGESKAEDTQPQETAQDPEQTSAQTNCDPQDNNGNQSACDPDAAATEDVTITDKKSAAVYRLSGKDKTAACTGCIKKGTTKVTIPAVIKSGGVTYKVTSIADGAFKNNKKLTSVTIGKNITRIGKSAFEGCKKLKSIRIKTVKLTAKTTGAKAFRGTAKKAVVTVPKSKKSAYRKLLLKKGLSSKATVK